MNMKQYLGIDSGFKKPNGESMSHEEMYTNMVLAVGISKLEALMPVTIDELEVALDEDPNLNNIPLELWDRRYGDVRRHFNRLGIFTTSMSQTVCTLKQAARMLVERDQAERTPDECETTTV